MKYITPILGLLLLVLTIGCIENNSVPLPYSPGGYPETRYIEPGITDKYCDANNPCPEGLECWKLPDKNLACVDPNPCKWFCHMEKCIVLESYPPKLLCQE